MKRIVFICFLCLSLVVIYNLVSSIVSLLQKHDVLSSAQQELEKEKKENKELVQKYTYAKSPEFVEEEARNKLFLVKHGESQVILPQEALKKKQEPQKAEETPNWKKWFDLFFPQE